MVKFQFDSFFSAFAYSYCAVASCRSIQQFLLRVNLTSFPCSASFLISNHGWGQQKPFNRKRSRAPSEQLDLLLLQISAAGHQLWKKHKKWQQKDLLEAFFLFDATNHGQGPATFGLYQAIALWAANLGSSTEGGNENTKASSILHVQHVAFLYFQRAWERPFHV